jgi:hypothetical protein
MKTPANILKLVAAINESSPVKVEAFLLNYRAHGKLISRKGWAVRVIGPLPYHTSDKEFFTFEPCFYTNYKWFIYGAKFDGSKHVKTLQEATKLALQHFKNA